MVRRFLIFLLLVTLLTGIGSSAVGCRAIQQEEWDAKIKKEQEIEMRVGKIEKALKVIDQWIARMIKQAVLTKEQIDNLVEELLRDE